METDLYKDYLVKIDADNRMSYIYSLQNELLHTLNGLTPEGWFDERGYLFQNGVMVASNYFSYHDKDKNIPHEYYLLNTQFEKINTLPFEYLNDMQTHNGCVRAHLNGKHGWIKTDGTWFLPPIYDKVYGDDDPPYGSFYEVYQNGLIGFISDEPEVILPCVVKQKTFCDYWSNMDTQYSLYRVQHHNGKFGLLEIQFYWNQTPRYRNFFTGFIYDEIETGDNMLHFTIGKKTGMFYFGYKGHDYLNLYAEDDFEPVKNALPYTEKM